MSSAFTHVLLQAAVIGVFGGAALVLTQLYSRRGPMIYPVYAAILLAALAHTRHRLRVPVAVRRRVRGNGD